jgi:hypothetical protein
MRLLDAAAQVTHEIEGGLVGPMDIFNGQQRKRTAFADVREHRAKDDIARRVFGQKLIERRIVEIEEWPERARCREGVTVANDDASAGLDIVAERSQQDRLADAGLAAEQHQAAMPNTGLREKPLQLLPDVVSLEKFHSTLPGRGRRW